MLLGVVMFGVTGGSLVGPILPAMMELEGATSKNIGLALSSYTFTAMVATLALGPLADRFGRKTIIDMGSLLHSNQPKDSVSHLPMS